MLLLKPHLISLRFVLLTENNNRKFAILIKEDGFYVSDNFQEIHSPLAHLWQLAVSANSSILQLFANVTGRANFGDGLMKIQTYEVGNLTLLKPTLLDTKTCKASLVDAERLELQDSDRKTLDDIVFNALGLTQGERDAVYEAVINLVEARLSKAGSV